MSRLTARLQSATTTGTTQVVAAGVTPATDGSGPGMSDPKSAPPRSRLERRVLLVTGALMGGVLAAVVLAGALSDAMASRASVLDARQTNQALLEQVEAGRREVDFAQTPAFLAFAARSFGWGAPRREHAFALRPGGPPPPVIEPLGVRPGQTTPSDPLRSVVDLLFER